VAALRHISGGAQSVMSQGQAAVASVADSFLARTCTTTTDESLRIWNSSLRMNFIVMSPSVLLVVRLFDVTLPE
jgi:hypothetical protein